MNIIHIFSFLTEVKRNKALWIKGCDKIISKEIKRILLEKDMQVKDLAVLLKCTPENLYKKFKKDDWKESDIIEIANVLNCEYIQQLKMK